MSSNSTYTFTCPDGETCDFMLGVTINVTCTGCSFSGDYAYPPGGTTLVSGTGSKLYYASTFDRPLSVSWNISKSTEGGILEVRVDQQGGNFHYDRTTSAPFGTLSGRWDVDVEYQVWVQSKS